MNLPDLVAQARSRMQAINDRAAALQAEAQELQAEKQQLQQDIADLRAFILSRGGTPP